MFKTRLISGIILVALALLTIIPGGFVLFITCLALSLIAAGEFYTATAVRPKDKPFGLLDGAGYVGILLIYLCVGLLPERSHTLGIVFAMLLLMFVYVFTFPKYSAKKVFAAFFAVVYVGFLFSCIYQTRMLEGGNFHVWLIFISAWGADTCAYCVGMLFGKTKLAPILSPKKSVEGAIGGVIGASVLGLVYALCVKESILSYLIICLFGAVISMIGDLSASAIKRNTDIKDYGTLIPGHGGILDRFDSILFTAPVIYYLCTLLTG